MKGLSTELALLKQKKLLLFNIQTKLITLGIFIDFTKSFVRINHYRLFTKLYLHRVRGIALKSTKSYLHDRYQSVEINKKRYNLQPQTARVPKASIFGKFSFQLVQ